MNEKYNGELLREQVFNYRRGELSEIDQALFEDGMVDFPEDAQYAGRLMEMLDLAADADAEMWLDETEIEPARADALFDAITAQIEREQHASGAPPVRLEFGNTGQDDVEEDFAPTSRPWLRVVVALAAVGLLALAVSTMAPDVDAPKAPEIAKKEVPQTPAPVAPPATFALDTLEPARSPSDAVKVFASPKTRWKIEGKAPEYVLKLDEGTVLVEFLPRDNERLRVISGDTEISVLGTVFYVSKHASKKPTRVGVLTGKVRVDRETQAPVTLRDGQEVLESQAQVREIPTTLLERGDALVDIEDHKSAIATLQHQAARQAPPQEEPKRVAPRDRPEDARAVRQARIARLSKQARRAIRDKNHGVAATAYEELVRLVPSRSRRAAEARLELTRLYMKELRQSHRAIPHLRNFVQNHPSDPAAPVAKRNLCRLLGSKAAQDPMCL